MEKGYICRRKDIKMKKISMILLLAFTLALNAFGQAFSLSKAFSDGVVLAKGKPVRVFGEGDGRIIVRIAGKKAVCEAADGRWEAVLPAMKAGGPYRMSVKHGREKTIVEDVYIGTVIVMAGQSNIQFKLKESSSDPASWTGDPLTRSFSLPRIEAGEPYTPDDGWIRCEKSDAGNWSAIGYLVARNLRLDNPKEAVGIINCYQGASVIESWIPADRLENDLYKLPKDQIYRDHYHKIYGQWNGDGQLFRYTLSAITPFSVSGVVWYQGESNTGVGEPAIYPLLARELILAWRDAFKDETLPFTIVQIADFKSRTGTGWKGIQEAQLRIPSLVTGVTVVRSADVCEDDNIHPRTKDALSERIAETVATW